MLIRTIASAVAASLLLTSTAFVTVPSVEAQQVSTTLTVPVGTAIPLTLVNPIKSKSTHPGDSLRAVVAFPVTVGEQVAIPAGTYVEGTLLAPLPKVKRKPDPGVQIHFTRLVFANGYSAPLDANLSAALDWPEPASPNHAGQESPYSASRTLTAVMSSVIPENPVASLAFFRLPTLASGWRPWMISLQAFPPIDPVAPTLPKNGPSIGLIFGISLGVTAAIIVAGILFHHKAADSDFIVHDAGWQFQVKLEFPLTLNTSLIGPQKP